MRSRATWASSPPCRPRNSSQRAASGCAGSGCSAAPETAMSFDAEYVGAALDAIDRDWHTGGACVGLSGGLDSTVLLHAMSILARARDFGLRALHVDHGLQAASREWAESCGRLCADLGVPLTVLRPGIAPEPGDSVEAAARDARYAALAGEL